MLSTAVKVVVLDAAHETVCMSGSAAISATARMCKSTEYGDHTVMQAAAGGAPPGAGPAQLFQLLSAKLSVVNIQGF